MLSKAASSFAALATRDADPSEKRRLIHLFAIVLISLAISCADAKLPHCSALFLLLAATAFSWQAMGGVVAWMAFVAQLGRVTDSWPYTANHYFLQLVLLALFSLLSASETSERPLLLVLCRWSTVLAIFYAGVQKALYGQYFDGRMLATLLSKHERYQMFFAPLVSEAELLRLQNYDLHLAGSGPYRFESPLMLVISNATWFGEIALAGMLLWMRRDLAVWISIGFFFCMELAAREVVFGYLMIGLLMLFLRVGSAMLVASWILFGLLLCAIALEYIPGKLLWFPLG